MRPTIAIHTVTLIAVTLALTACPKEARPPDDGAGEETTGPQPAAEPQPAGEPASSAGHPGAAETGPSPTCEDELAKAQVELAACIAAQG